MMTFSSMLWGIRRWVARIDRRGFCESVLIAAAMMLLMFIAHGGR